MKCKSCKGKGYIGFGDFDETFCDECGGSGKKEDAICEILFTDSDGHMRTVSLCCDEIVVIPKNGFRVRTIDNTVNSSSVVKLWKPGSVSEL